MFFKVFMETYLQFQEQSKKVLYNLVSYLVLVPDPGNLILRISIFLFRRLGLEEHTSKMIL